MTLLRVWQSTLRKNPTALAIRDSLRPEGWTRRQLDSQAEEWTRRTAASSAELSGRAVFFAEANGAAWFERFLGLLQLGAIPAPLDPGEPLAAQRATAQAAGGAYFATAERIEPIAGARRRRTSQVALIKTTSGTVGVPRALPFTAEQMLADGRQVALTMGIAPQDQNFALIPLGHSYGLGNLVMPFLASGTSIVCGSGILPHVWAADIKRWAPTVFPAVPPVLAALADSEVSAGDLRSLRVVISAGSPLAPEVAARFRRRFGRFVHNFYGSSETGGIAYDRTGQCTLTGRSIGRPLRGVRLRFAPRERFAVESAAVSGGAHRPADRGCLNAKGELVLLGRTGRTVKLSGKRVDLAEVEKALQRLPGVSAAVVFLPADSRGLSAAVAGTNLPAPRALAQALQPNLAAWKIPRRWISLAALPVTARGKPDARAIRRLFP